MSDIERHIKTVKKWQSYLNRKEPETVGDAVDLDMEKDALEDLESFLQQVSQQLDQKQSDLDKALADVRGLEVILDLEIDEYDGRAASVIRARADELSGSVEWLHQNYPHLDGPHLGILTDRARRLRQQAAEIEGGDDDKP